MLVLKVDEDPIEEASLIMKLEPQDLQEWNLPLHMAGPLSNPASTQAVNQINVPHQYEKSMEDFSR